MADSVSLREGERDRKREGKEGGEVWVA